MATDRIVTVAASGGDYTSLKAAAAEETPKDISIGSGSDERVRFQCDNFEDTVLSGFEDPHFTSDWVTDRANGNYILVEPLQAHPGIFGHTSAYRIVGSRTFGGVITVEPGVDITFRGITAVQTATGDNQQSGFTVDMAAGQHVEFIRCMVDFQGSGATVNGSFGLRLFGNTAHVLRVRNSYIRGFPGGFASVSVNAAAAWVFDNNGFIDNTVVGLSLFGADGSLVAHLRNNIMVGGSTDGDYESPSIGQTPTINTATNVTEDATSPEGASFQGSRPTFVNEGAGNYLLAAGDSVAQNRGTNLSADGTWAHNEDILGNAQTGTWEIGPHQLVEAAEEAGLPTKQFTRLAGGLGALSGGIG